RRLASYCPLHAAALADRVAGGLLTLDRQVHCTQPCACSRVGCAFGIEEKRLYVKHEHSLLCHQVPTATWPSPSRSNGNSVDVRLSSSGESQINRLSGRQSSWNSR